MNDNATWETVRAKINGLWPRYEPTPAERELTVRRLCNLNQRWLDAAVDEYRADSASTVFRLAELLERYKRIASAGEPGREARPAQRAADERERWTRERTRDHASALVEMRSFHRTDIAAAVSDLRAKGWIPTTALPSNLADWPISSLLFVHARLTLDRMRPAAADSVAGEARRAQTESYE